MYLTTIELDMGSTDARRDVRQPYEMHRTLMRFVADDARPLFRIDRERGSLHVQTVERVDWIDFPYSCGVETVERGQYPTGTVREFHLWANPTKSHSHSEKRANGVSDKRRTRAITDPRALHEWIHRQGERGGFEVMDCEISRDVNIGRGSGKAAIGHIGREYQGVLRVTDGDLFQQILGSGIGRAKAFGFGLLLLSENGAIA